jgi:ketosteroid isomerase-like protein
VRTPDPAPRAILRRYQQALVDKSADDLADLYAADAVHELPFLLPGMPDRLEGREQVRAAYRAAWAASDARPQAVRMDGLGAAHAMGRLPAVAAALADY